MTVSAVIPTVGRPSLYRAVRSVLAQSEAVDEVIIVADTDRPVYYPPDNRITLLRNDFPRGPAVSRRRGIDVAQGSIIALLDDDDEWHPEKIKRQLAAVGDAGPHWIVSCRMAVVGPGERRRVWPRRLIGPREPLADYLFRFTGLRQGGRALQTSTLCFPAVVARAVPWDSHMCAVHDESSWLLGVARRLPDLQVIQLPEVLSTYNVSAASLSRHAEDITDRYIDWGLLYLKGESARVRGDYLCSSPVSAAVAARSLGGIGRAVRAGLRHGSPGLPALGFAALNAVRVIAPEMSARNRS